MTLDLNKIRFYETTLDIKHLVEEMEVWVTKVCHFFSVKDQQGAQIEFKLSQFEGAS
jgi:hypothetical protein